MSNAVKQAESINSEKKFPKKWSIEILVEEIR